MRQTITVQFFFFASYILFMCLSYFPMFFRSQKHGITFSSDSEIKKIADKMDGLLCRRRRFCFSLFLCLRLSIYGLLYRLYQGKWAKVSERAHTLQKRDDGRRNKNAFIRFCLSFFPPVSCIYSIHKHSIIHEKKNRDNAQNEYYVCDFCTIFFSPLCIVVYSISVFAKITFAYVHNM